MKVKFIFILTSILIISCREDSVQPGNLGSEQVKTYLNVDDRLWPYFAKFEKEGKSRGLSVDLSFANISGELIQLHEDGVAGSCSYGGRQRNAEVSIDSDFWNRATTEFREYIVFHELGHCYLFRDHREDCLNNGIWASIMRSGTLKTCRDLYNEHTRTYYLDELFDVDAN